MNHDGGINPTPHQADRNDGNEATLRLVFSSR
jgi:hypothetical protein